MGFVEERRTEEDQADDAEERVRIYRACTGGKDGLATRDWGLIVFCMMFARVGRMDTIRI